MKLRNIIFFAVINTVLCGLVFAQNNSEYKKVELSGGVTTGYLGEKANAFDTIGIPPTNRPFKERVTGGYYGSATFNFHRYFGVKTEFAYHQTARNSVRTTTYTEKGLPIRITQAFDIRMNLKRKMFSVLSGIQIKDNSSDKRFKPFGHILVGIGRTEANAKNVVVCSSSSNCTPSPNINNKSDINFSGAVGGGLDIRLNDRYEIRAFQLDYNPIFLEAGTAHNFRASAGFVVRF